MIQRLVLIILLLCLGLLIPTVLAMPGGSTSFPLRALTVALLVLLGWRWYRWSRGGRWHYADLGLESLVIILASISVGDPFPTLGLFYTAFYYRPLAGTIRFAAVGALVTSGALFTGAYFAGHETHSVLSPGLLSQLPIFATTAILGIVLAYTFQRQQRLTDDLTEAELQYRSLVEQLPEVVYTATMDGIVTYMSPQAVDILGAPTDRLVNVRVEDFEFHVDPQDRAYFRETYTRAVNDHQPFQLEYRFQSETRGLIWLRVQGNPIRGQDGAYSHWLGTISDITERKGLEDRLSFQAFHDHLTGLPNRALFHDRLEHAIARSARAGNSLAVLFLDLDNFKIVNDSLGHQAGDELIQMTAQRLESVVREADTVARIGGDEFVLLLEDLVDEEEPIEVAERILEVLGTDLYLKNQSLNVSASIGIVMNHGNDASANDIIRQADLAMYAAKRNGRSRYAVYAPSMGVNAVERLEIETGLRRALQRDELAVHYQPVVDLRTGKISEVEGLVRWNHPERGMLPPGAFLDVAEESGLIREIDLWMLREVCKQVRAWQATCPDHASLIASVNLSASLLREETLTEQVAAILQETNLEPRHLKLEITEHAMIADIKQAKEALIRLGNLGVRLAIDDFGTGNSALNYLRDFPIDTLKIDRSFVTGLNHGHGDAAMVQALITLAQSLGLSVTAEGIEGNEYVDLRRFGCDQGQGYHFSRPQESSTIEDLLLQPAFALELPRIRAGIAAD